MFIDGAKRIDSPAYYQRPAYIRVYKGSQIRYSSRINFDVACQLDFHYYPNDEQTCAIKFESFGHTTEYMRLSWHTNASYISPVLSMKHFTMKAVFGPSYKTDTFDLIYPGI